MVIKFVLILTLPIFFIACKQPENQQSKQAIKAKHFSKVAFVLYDNFDTALLHFAIAEVTAFYHCSAIVLPAQPLPSFAFYEPRQRYKADSLIKYQSSIAPEGIESVIGLTQKDISTSLDDKADWGIFGLGYCPGKACVISVFRLRATTYGQYKERFIKVLLHELGHNQGLPHCNKSEFCLMADAKGTIATVDKEKKWLCAHCRKLLSD